jgi:hypothetical protein
MQVLVLSQGIFPTVDLFRSYADIGGGGFRRADGFAFILQLGFVIVPNVLFRGSEINLQSILPMKILGLPIEICVEGNIARNNSNRTWFAESDFDVIFTKMKSKATVSK